MKKILAIALLNFKSAVKEKIFIGIVFFFIIFLAVTILLSILGVGESQKVLRNAGLVGIELTGLILIIFSLVFSYYQDHHSRMQEVYLSFLSRSEYIAGKLLGYILLVISYCLISGIGYGLVLYFKQAFGLKVIIGIYPLFLKLSIILFFTLLFSVIFSSNFVALFSSLFIYLSSELSKFALELITKKGTQLQIIIFKFFYYILPSFDKLDIKTQAVYEKIPGLSFFTYITLYSLGYLIFLYLLTCLIFRKKEV